MESSGRNFTLGQPILRFENHVFFDKWGQAHAATFDQHYQFGGRNGIPGRRHQNHKYRVDPTQPFAASHVDRQAVEYEAFGLAENLGGREAAALSSSWGGPQVMGFNHAILGYTSASEMADAFASTERWHVLGFADFCRDKRLIDEIQTRNWHDFGQIYNGDGAVYGPKIEAAYNLRDRLLALPRLPPGGFSPGLVTGSPPKAGSVKLDTTFDAQDPDAY